MSETKQKAEALFSVGVCCYYASLFVHLSGVRAVLQIGFYLFFILQFHLKLFESDLNLDKMSEN